ncbi:MAG: Trk system potassium transporter TrkA [Proteobacteria bacterium]|nr:Trk system potassium transporter TrkA [Pseudomonadota bacterium]
MRVIIIGAGQVGSAITGALAGERADVVAVDLIEDLLKDLRDLYDIQTICGSGSNPLVLAEAGVESADMIVAVTDSDEVNMVASAIARLRAPHAIKVARVRERAFLEDEAVLGKGGFGVDHAINPELVAAERIHQILNVPFAVDVADCGHGLKLIGIRLPEGTELEGCTFAKLRSLHPDLKMLVTTRIRQGECHVPSGSDDIRGGDTLFAVSRPEDLPSVAELFHFTWRPVKRVTVAGGSGIAAILAERLENQERCQVKLIESDITRANALAESLERVLVLRGNPTDENLLLEENIRDCDVFVAALPEAEMNVMAALNAKRLGAHRVIALTDKLNYIPIIENAGVDAVVSPRALAIGTILHHIRRGKVKAVIPYGHASQAEAIAFEALQTSQAVGKSLKDVRFPEGAIVGALIRDGRAIIPGGNDIIQPGDDVFVFATKSVIPKLERLMAVRLEFF